MSEIDQQFIEYVVKSLVGKPDAVQIERRIDEKGVLLELTVDPEDLGRVIGKRGATAQSLRTLLRALGTKNDARYNLKIIDNGPLDKGRGGEDRPASDSGKPDDGGSPDSRGDNNSDESIVNEAVDSAARGEAEAGTSADNESQPEETAAEEVPETATEETPASSEEEQASDRLAQTRKELADLDDLDL